MKPERQRIAIAEACNWKSTLYRCQDPECEDCAGALGGHETPRPDYLNDLNAMHESFNCKRNERNFIARYFGHLYGILDTDGSVPAQLHDDDLIHNATAAKRAEAFLRTIGKWEDE